jgi:hypothetical protein
MRPPRKRLFRGRLRVSPPLVLIHRGNQLAEQLLEHLRKRFEAGETETLLDAVDICARCAMPLPLWAAEEFCACYVSWAQFEVRTLDEAFGVPRKGVHAARRKHREWLRLQITLRVSELQDEGMPTDEALFEQIGADLGIGGSTAREIFYEPATKVWRKLLPNFEIS